MSIQKRSFKTCSIHKPLRKGFVIVLDVGTTGIKAFVFDSQCQVKAKVYKTISKNRLKTSWVEQDPREIINVSRVVLRKAVKDSGVPIAEILGVGITNQREATIVWDRKTGKPVYPAIGWEDKRTAEFCKKISRADAVLITSQTGLNPDPYFSGSKVRWILENVKGAREKAEAGKLAFGTIDTWLMWSLCENQPHVTDETNAARTILFDISKRQWSKDLLKLFDVPNSVLPRVLSSRAVFGNIKKDIFGRSAPVLAVCGDQQSSAYAAICVQPSSRKNITKVTYGTGVFVVQTIGKQFALHKPFFTTLVPARGKGSVYALEGKLEGSGEAVTSLLKQPKKLEMYFKNLAKSVDKLIDKLPSKPQELVIDGGSARDGIVTLIQQETSGIPVCQQMTYDGTALGTALLVWNTVIKR